MSESAIICLFNHDTRKPFTEYCPTCLQIACAAKDKEIAELRSQIGNDFMAGVVIEHEKRIAAARLLIGSIGWTSCDFPDVIKAAEKWLEGKP